MFQTKICGVTTAKDAVAAADAGADAIGLNFYEKSPRSVSNDRAQEIAAAVRGGPLLVGVFVNAAPGRIRAVVESVGLDAVQVHGDEPPELAAELPVSVAIVRAIRREPTSGLAPGVAWAAAAATAGRSIGALLVDAVAPPNPGGQTVYGGSGVTTDWTAVAAERGDLGGTPLILAGGLRPKNVAEAVTVSGADGVDTASGVESAPGIKDAGLVREFVQQAQEALARRLG